MAKTKRFMDGGYVPPNQYPFANPNSVQVGERQEPLEGITGDQESVTMYKRGGKVKKYADGGIYKAEMGQPPMDPEVAKPDKKKPKPDPDANIFTAEKVKGGKAPRDLMPEDFKKPIKKAGGGCAKGYAGGGSVRGAGIAKRGVRQCKVV